MKFAVSGLAGHPVASAKLRLFCSGGSDKGGDFYRVADTSWAEKGVTWNNAPVPDAVPLASLGPVASSQWIEIDVTPLVTGEGTFSLRVKTLSADSADYKSKEEASKAPQLVVTLQP